MEILGGWRSMLEPRTRILAMESLVEVRPFPAPQLPLPPERTNSTLYMVFGETMYMSALTSSYFENARKMSEEANHPRNMTYIKGGLDRGSCQATV